jgi:4a-hydroxytetrahydrobiopterin dehydratase
MAKKVSASPPGPKVPKLSDAQVSAALSNRPAWVETGEAIQRTFQFKTFVEAMAFVNKAAELAEADQHHPDILVRYNKVTITLSTHDAGGISHKDFEMAAKLDGLG